MHVAQALFKNDILCELIQIPIIYAGGSLDTDATTSEKSKKHSAKDYLMLTFANHTIYDKVSLPKTKKDFKNQHQSNRHLAFLQFAIP